MLVPNTAEELRHHLELSEEFRDDAAYVCLSFLSIKFAQLSHCFGVYNAGSEDFNPAALLSYVKDLEGGLRLFAGLFVNKHK